MEEKNKTIIDSNIIIGIGNGYFPLSVVDNYYLFASDITLLEVMGFHQMKLEEEIFLKQFFEEIVTIRISQEIIYQGIKFRKNKSMGVGDAIIAATALLNDLPLITANSKDF